MSRSKPPALTDAQREIMEIVWTREQATVSEIRQALDKKGRHVARNTVQTMVARLEDKGWLQHKVSGNTYVYSAATKRSRALGAKVSQLIDRFFAGSPEEMVTALIEYRGLTPEEAQSIREMIEASESEASEQKNRKPPRRKKG